MQLLNYLDTLQDEGESLEKYSKYLYRLEKNKEISQEEKDAYIGVYRLLRQIEKGDDAAIGTLVSKNQEMNFEKFGEINRRASSMSQTSPFSS